MPPKWADLHGYILILMEQLIQCNNHSDPVMRFLLREWYERQKDAIEETAQGCADKG